VRHDLICRGITQLQHIFYHFLFFLIHCAFQTVLFEFGQEVFVLFLLHFLRCCLGHTSQPTNQTVIAFLNKDHGCNPHRQDPQHSIGSTDQFLARIFSPGMGNGNAKYQVKDRTGQKSPDVHPQRGGVPDLIKNPNQDQKQTELTNQPIDNGA